MDNEERYERYIPVELSILGSLLEIREMRAGRLPEKSWEEVRAEIERKHLRRIQLWKLHETIFQLNNRLSAR